MFYRSIAMAALVVLITATSSGCLWEEEADNEAKEPETEETVNISYVDWESEIASSYVVKAVIEEKMGYTCELLEVSASAMWESVAEGDQDAMVGAWLPELQKAYYEEHQDELIDLGPNLENAETGLVVPDYVPVDSIDELNDHVEKFDERIIGIDPEAGIMSTTERVMEEYGLDDFELVTGSDYTMTTTLEGSIAKEHWIVVTGWTPHWKFSRWDLQYLEDPQNSFGDQEYISTMVRKGLKEDMPEVYSFLDNFYWEPEDMGQVMLWIQEEDTTPEEAALRWIDENEIIVEGWLEDS